MFSIIIPVKNDARIFDCLDSLFKQQFSDFEIIVVENGNGMSWERVASFSKVKVVKHLIPGSFSARNQGITLARGDIVAFIDADCLADTSWLKKAADFFVANPHIDLLGGKINLYGRQKELNWIETYESIFYLDQKRYVQELGYAATANFFVRKEVFDRVGLFGGNVNAEEERAWCFRAMQQGCRLGYCSEAQVNHPLRSDIVSLTSAAIRDVTGQIFYRSKGVSYLHRLWIDKIVAFRNYCLLLKHASSVSFGTKIMVLGLILYLGVIHILVGGAIFLRILSNCSLSEKVRKENY